MAYLIDGNNLLGHISEYPIRDPRGRYKLVSELLVFQRIRKVRIILVFDGPPDEMLEQSLSGHPKFALRFPELNENADKIIKEIISHQPNKRRFFVVSNDREIKKFARSHGFKTISCAEFARELKQMVKKNKKYQEMQKKEPCLSPLETEHWQKIFKSK